MKSYTEQIRTKLWKGNASILVGAGFSRNAEPQHGVTKGYPLWSGLNEHFIEILSPQWYQEQKHKVNSGELTKEQYVAILQGFDTVGLAEDLERKFGRSELERIMRESMPSEEQYKPSDLHRELLELPWRDVFTTNYDTLLERTAQIFPQVALRGYNVITRQEELIDTGSSPRIIKLHGTFPSIFPFIITESDFESYHRNYPAFVNTVQQSIIETTFCLVGFSGNDPNFQAWAKWIKTSLGAYAPKIFLIALESMQEYEKRKLETLNTMVVDLSKIYAEEKNPSVLLKKFFADLTIPEKDRWLNVKLDAFNTILRKPLIIDDIINKLEHTRETYPGWLVVPRIHRQRLEHIRGDAESILHSYVKGHYDILKGLKLLHEYDWLREKCLRPPFTNELKIYKKILDDCKNCKGLTDNERSLIVDIRLSLMRDARESGLLGEWKIHCDECVVLSNEQNHRLCHESILYSLFAFDFKEFLQCLNKWEVNHVDFHWTLRRCGLLCEAGLLNDAEVALKESLKHLRKQLISNHNDLRLLSLESALMSLLNTVVYALNFHVKDSINEQKTTSAKNFEARQIANHKQADVDWGNENNEFTLRLIAPFIPEYNHKTETPTFDIGIATSSIVMGETKTQKEIYEAMSFLRFREESGHPFRIANIVFFNNDVPGIVGAATRIAPWSIEWALASLMRANNSKSLDGVLTRPMLVMHFNKVERLADLFVGVLNTLCDDRIRGETVTLLMSYAFNLIPNILSRLCTMCSLNELDRMLDLAYKMYCCGEGSSLGINEIKHFINRLMDSFSDSELLTPNRVSRLLGFPLVKIPTGEYPDPIRFLPFTHNSTQKISFSQDEIDGISTLLEAVSADGTDNIHDLTGRLMILSNNGLLTEHQHSVFVGALINQKLKMPTWLLPTSLMCINIDVKSNENIVKPIKNKVFEDMSREISLPAGVTCFPPQDLPVCKFLTFLRAAESGLFEMAELDTLVSLCEKAINGCVALHPKYHQKDMILASEDFIPSHIRNVCFGLYHSIAQCPEWNPSAESVSAMDKIVSNTNSSTNSISYCPYISILWNKIMGKSLDLSFMESDLLSHDRNRQIGIVSTLNLSFHYPAIELFDKTTFNTCFSILCQQVLWCRTSLLNLALDAICYAINRKKIELPSDIENYVRKGVEQLYDETKVTAYDSVATAGSKVSTRKKAFQLAVALHNLELNAPLSKSVSKWTNVFDDMSEFSDVRKAVNIMCDKDVM